MTNSDVIAQIQARVDFFTDSIRITKIDGKIQVCFKTEVNLFPEMEDTVSFQEWFKNDLDKNDLDKNDLDKNDIISISGCIYAVTHKGTVMSKAVDSVIRSIKNDVNKLIWLSDGFDDLNENEDTDY